MGEKERDCGILHLTIEDAINHAEERLGCRAEKIEPFWGKGTFFAAETVVGWMVTPRKRWRLDYDPNPDKGVHVNEENYDAHSSDERKVVHRVKDGSHLILDTFWRKWTKRFTPGTDQIVQKAAHRYVREWPDLQWPQLYNYYHEEWRDSLQKFQKACESYINEYPYLKAQLDKKQGR
jgi:hypothetical protein